MKPSYFGIDISDHNVEVVALERKHGGTTLGLRGSTEIPAGTMDHGTIFREDTFVTVLKALVSRVFGSEKGKLVAGVSLPESRVYSSVFRLPLDLQGEDLDRATYGAALDRFPVDLRDMVTDRTVVATDEDTQHVLFAAIEENIIEGYAKALARAGITPLFFELESAALGRALIPTDATEPALVADLGTKTSTLAVHDEGGVRMSSSVPIGGNNLTSAIENKLNISYAEAERLKQEFGFDPDANDGRVMLILQNPVADIVEEIRKTIEYYKKTSGKDIRKVFLAGGTALTPEISDYVASNFPGVAVEIGDPFTKVGVSKELEESDFRKKSILFGTATGLALRVLNPRATGQLNLLPGARRSQKGISAAMNKARDLTSSLLSMVTRSKKSTPKKKPAKKKAAPKKAALKKKPAEKEKPVIEEVAIPVEAEMPEAAMIEEPEVGVETPEAVESQETEKASDEKAHLRKELAAKLMTEGMPEAKAKSMAEATEEERLAELMETRGVFDSTLGDDSVLAQISPALSSLVDDDYEHSDMPDLGDELEESGVQPPSNAELYREQLEGIAPASAADEGDIYRDHGTPKEHAEDVEEVPVSAQKKKGSKMLIVGLVVLAVILFAAAAGGVYMFVGKGNTTLLPGPIAALFGGGDEETLVPADTGVETASSSVGLTFVASTTEQETAGGRPFVLARILETDVEITSDFEATGIGESTEGKAKGVITVVNETSRQYTFVATTRFISEDGVLFRLNKQSVIAADGGTDVQVTADVAGGTGDVNSTDWIIPGLSASLQAVVWGRSSAGMTGGSGTTTMVSVDDLADAKAELEDLLWEEAESNFRSMLAAGEDLHDDLYVWEEISLDAPEEGAELSSFEMGMGLQFQAMIISSEAVVPLMDERLGEALPEGEAAVDYELGAVSYTIEAYDIASETAVIRAEAPVIKL